MKIEVELNIPQLDALTGAVEKLAASIAATGGGKPAAPHIHEIHAAETPKMVDPKKVEPKAPKEKKAPAAVEVTEAEVTEVARKLVNLRTPGELRKVLDTVIKPSEKISTCDKSHYAAIKEALDKKVAEVEAEDEAGL